jgi:hypothetical protein
MKTIPPTKRVLLGPFLVRHHHSSYHSHLYKFPDYYYYYYYYYYDDDNIDVDDDLGGGAEMRSWQSDVFPTRVVPPSIDDNLGHEARVDRKTLRHTILETIVTWLDLGGAVVSVSVVVVVVVDSTTTHFPSQIVPPRTLKE